MLKRNISILLCILTAVLCITGCGKNNGEKESDNVSNTISEQQSSEKQTENNAESSDDNSKTQKGVLEAAVSKYSQQGDGLIKGVFGDKLCLSAVDHLISCDLVTGEEKKAELAKPLQYTSNYYEFRAMPEYISYIRYNNGSYTVLDDDFLTDAYIYNYDMELIAQYADIPYEHYYDKEENVLYYIDGGLSRPTGFYASLHRIKDGVDEKLRDIDLKAMSLECDVNFFIKLYGIYEGRLLYEGNCYPKGQGNGKDCWGYLDLDGENDEVNIVESVSIYKTEKGYIVHSLADAFDDFSKITFIQEGKDAVSSSLKNNEGIHEVSCSGNYLFTNDSYEKILRFYSIPDMTELNCIKGLDLPHPNISEALREYVYFDTEANKYISVSY